jgi:hypothetical protein
MIAPKYGPRGEIRAAFWTSHWDGAWGPQPGATARCSDWLASIPGSAVVRAPAKKKIFATARMFPNRPCSTCAFVSEYLRKRYRVTQGPQKKISVRLVRRASTAVYPSTRSLHPSSGEQPEPATLRPPVRTVS